MLGLGREFDVHISRRIGARGRLDVLIFRVLCLSSGFYRRVHLSRPTCSSITRKLFAIYQCTRVQTVSVRLYCRRTLEAVYWPSAEATVLRGTWFKVRQDGTCEPYDELSAAALEHNFGTAHATGEWGKRVETDSGELVILHSESVCVHYNKQDAASMRRGSPGVAGGQQGRHLMAVRGWRNWYAVGWRRGWGWRLWV